MKFLTYSTFISCLLILASCTPKANNGSPGTVVEIDGTKLYFQTLKQGVMSGINKKEEHLVTEGKQWGNLWGRIHSNETPVPNMPSVNFSINQVLAVFMGSKNTGGYGIEIKQVVDTGKQIVAVVTEITPPEGSITTQAITQPYHIIKIENPEGKPVVFK